MNLEKFKSAELNAQEMRNVNGGDWLGEAYNVWVSGVKIASTVAAAAGHAYAEYVTAYPNRNT